jgi:HPr kinase/phosphorylase
VRQLAGLIEIRGLGIRRCAFAKEAIVGLVVDLSADDAERLPAPEKLQTSILGITLPRIPVGTGHLPVPLVVAALTTTAGSVSAQLPADCLKGFGNHMMPSIATE